VKTAVKHMAGAHAREALIAEVSSLVELSHPCIIRMIGWWWDEGHSTRSEIHTEFAPNGSLHDLLSGARRGLREFFGSSTAIAKLICRLVLGMRYVHSKGIIHRDMKPSNILFDEHWRPKIIDFGMSRLESSPGPTAADTGTVSYAAPEQLVGGGRHTTKIDVFSFGHILYEILTGQEVFGPSETVTSVQRRIREDRLPILPDRFGSLMQGLIRRCWSEVPTSRPSFDAIFQEFKECGFAILPDADSEAIKRSVDEVLALEVRPRHQKR
jgi:serine/threonine protein kinase